MSSKPPPFEREIANSADFQAVAIYFAEPTINLLFAELLQSRGVNVRIVESSDELPKATKIITEPQYFPLIAKEKHHQCLVVGNKSALKDIEALSLSRPLTEEKVEDALSQLLKA